MSPLFTNAIEVVLSILLMIGVGFFLERKNLLTESGNQLLSVLVVKVALPATILRNLLTQFDRATLLSSSVALLAPLLNMTVCFPISLILARVLRIPKSRHGVFSVVVTFSNTVFIGFPVTRALLGEQGISFALLYYLVNTCLFWSVGAGLIQRDSAGDRLTFRQTIQRMFSVPLVTLLICFGLVLGNIQPPRFIMDAAQYIGGMVTPLSMIFIGSMLGGMTRKGLRWMRGYGAILLMRFVLSPAIATGFSLLLGLPPLIVQSFFLQAGMPSMTQIAIVAHAMGADSEYASGATALTTVSLLPFLPLYALLLPHIG